MLKRLSFPWVYILIIVWVCIRKTTLTSYRNRNSLQRMGTWGHQQLWKPIILQHLLCIKLFRSSSLKNEFCLFTFVLSWETEQLIIHLSSQGRSHLWKRVEPRSLDPTTRTLLWCSHFSRQCLQMSWDAEDSQVMWSYEKNSNTQNREVSEH